MQILTAATCILAALVLFNLVLSFGLVRRLRVSRMGDGQPAFPTVGARIGPFSAVTLDDHELREPEVCSGTRLVAFFSTGCQPCGRLKDELSAGEPPDDLISFVTGNAHDEATQEFAHDLVAVSQWVSIVEPTGGVVEAFGVTAFPTLLRLADGVVQNADYRYDAIRAEAARRPA